MKSSRLVIISLLAWLSVSEAARILGIFPFPSISHQVVFHALMKDLAARGHELTIATTDLMEIVNPNVTQIDLHDSYEILSKFSSLSNDKNQDRSDVYINRFPIWCEILDSTLSDPAVNNLVVNSSRFHFDVVIAEYGFFSPIVAFGAVYDCPVIGITSFEAFFLVHEQFGNEANPAIHPDIDFTFSHGELTFVQRWESLVFNMKLKLWWLFHFESQYSKIAKKHFPEIQISQAEMAERVEFLMTNSHPILGAIRPLVPTSIQLGFMHIEPPKSLATGDLKTFLDNSDYGVIYMSLGTNVQSKDLSAATIRMLLKVFGNLNYDVVWKFEADHLPDKPGNVMISKWLPQSDMLAHPKIKLFITQCGHQSMEEAIARAVPMLAIPIQVDQHANARKMEKRGVAIHLDLDSLNEKSFSEAIAKSLLPEMKENIVNLRSLVYDQPMTSRERAVWWTEYVIRNRGGKNLSYPGRYVPFYQKYMLDFIGLGTIIFAAVIVTFLYVSRTVVSFTHKVKKE